MQFGASTWLWTSPFTGSDDRLLRKIADLGFDFVEIPVEDPAAIDGSAIASQLREYGLQAVVCAAVGGDRDLSSADPAKVEAATDYLQACIAFASQWESPLLVGPLYAPVGKARLDTESERQAEWQRSGENLGRVAQVAARAGIRLGIEPLNRFETDMVNTTADALRLVADIGHDNVGVSLDNFHMNIEEVNFRQAVEAAGDRLFHVQVSDSHRGVPGDGGSDWIGLREGLRQIGYDGRVSIESFTPESSGLAAAVCIWRRFAKNQDVFAERGLEFLQHWREGTFPDPDPVSENKIL